VRHAKTEGAGEIAALEADLQRLQAVAQDLQTRLEQARKRVEVSPDIKPAAQPKSSADYPPESAAPPQAGGNDWFLEFLE
jgi:hypothetical protein